jgi:phage baseplate assembly protein W
MQADFLGRGLTFPVEADPAASPPRLATNAGEEHIRQAIFLILATARGERVMRPDFGCGIHELVFSPDNSATLGMLEQEVRLALARWEPRVDVLDVTPQPRGYGHIVLIDIHYRVRSTNNLFNIVYPFYLEKGARP